MVLPFCSTKIQHFQPKSKFRLSAHPGAPRFYPLFCNLSPPKTRVLCTSRRLQNVRSKKNYTPFSRPSSPQKLKNRAQQRLLRIARFSRAPTPLRQTKFRTINKNQASTTIIEIYSLNLPTKSKQTQIFIAQ